MIRDRKSTRLNSSHERLSRESLDDQPVDLVFLLLAPEGAGADHLKALSRIARLLRDADTVAKIRGTRDANAILALLSQAPASHAA